MNFNWLQNINWAQPTWDLFVVLFFLVAVFLYGLSLGRERGFAILVSIYMSLAVVKMVPVAWMQNKPDLWIYQLVTFGVLFLILFFLLSRSTLIPSGTSGGWLMVMLFSFLHVGLLVSIVLAFLPAGSIEHLQPILKQIFVNETARFIWLIAPLIVLALNRGQAEQ